MEFRANTNTREKIGKTDSRCRVCRSGYSERVKFVCRWERREAHISAHRVSPEKVLLIKMVDPHVSHLCHSLSFLNSYHAFGRMNLPLSSSALVFWSHFVRSVLVVVYIFYAFSLRFYLRRTQKCRCDRYTIIIIHCTHTHTQALLIAHWWLNSHRHTHTYSI